MDIATITLEGKVILITGAANGMGQAYALGCAKAGAEVAGLDIESLESTGALVEQETGRELARFHGDMRDLEDIRRAVDGTVSRFGKLDVLVNNAGYLWTGPLLDTEEAALDRMIDVNLKGMFFACKYAARHMIARKAGVIINIGSELSHVGAAQYSAYAATKGGVLLLSHSLAIELGPYNIRVVTLCPGPTRTRMHDKSLRDPEIRKALESRGVLGRMNEPEDMAPTLVLLASDAARMVTGTSWSVDGGCLAK